jgi:predicted ester cyclase
MTTRWILGAVVIVSLAVVLSCVCEPCDEGQKNKELVAEALALTEAGDWERLAEYYAPDFVRHCQATPGFEVTDFEGFKELMIRDAESFSNTRMVLHRLVAEDDLVAFWGTYCGIQDGPMGPYPATGKQMDVDFGGTHRIVDGKIAETWVTWDNLSGLAQLGLYPPAPEKGASE